MLEIAIFILSNLFAVSSGIVEAILWSKKGTEATENNEHVYIVIQRAIYFITFILSAYFTVNIYVVTASLLSFSFFHDGAYYWFRNKIDGSYPERWKAESTTSTAIFEFSFKQRSIMAILGVVILLVFMLI